VAWLLELREWHPTKVGTAHWADQLTAGTAQRHQAATRVTMVVPPGAHLAPARPYVVFLPHGALNPAIARANKFLNEACTFVYISKAQSEYLR